MIDFILNGLIRLKNLFSNKENENRMDYRLISHNTYQSIEGLNVGHHRLNVDNEKSQIFRSSGLIERSYNCYRNVLSMSVDIGKFVEQSTYDYTDGVENKSYNYLSSSDISIISILSTLSFLQLPMRINNIYI